MLFKIKGLLLSLLSISLIGFSPVPAKAGQPVFKGNTKASVVFVHEGGRGWNRDWRHDWGGRWRRNDHDRFFLGRRYYMHPYNYYYGYPYNYHYNYTYPQSGYYPYYPGGGGFAGGILRLW